MQDWPAMVIVWTFVTAFAGGVLLIGELRGASWRVMAKMMASSGFLLVALASGATGSRYGRVLLVALLLSWVGDLLLTRPGAFLAGLGAFLLAHVGYIAAFGARGVDIADAVLPGIGAGVVAVLVWEWLVPHLGPMRRAVAAYVVVISVMVAMAAATGLGVVDARILLGAGAFLASDVAVARDRFIAPGVVNRLWGLPLYYTAQLLLAWSIGR